MVSRNERPALLRGVLVLFGLAILTAAMPVVGYVLLGLVIALVVGLVTWFVVLWHRTRWQPPDDRHRPARLSVPATRLSEREVA